MGDQSSMPIYISILSLIVAIISAVIAYLARKSARESAQEANRTAIGQLESVLRSSISNARSNMETRALNLSNILKDRSLSSLSAEEKALYDSANTAYLSAVEDWLNAYDEACSKYVDLKVDRARFKRTYRTEIRNLVEEKAKAVSTLLHPEGTTRFKSIWHVYRDFES